MALTIFIKCQQLPKMAIDGENLGDVKSSAKVSVGASENLPPRNQMQMHWLDLGWLLPL
jgi:hypothetical protein